MCHTRARIALNKPNQTNPTQPSTHLPNRPNVPTKQTHKNKPGPPRLGPHAHCGGRGGHLRLAGQHRQGKIKISFIKMFVGYTVGWVLFDGAVETPNFCFASPNVSQSPSSPFLQVWDMESFSCRRTLRGHDDDVLSLALWGGFLFRYVHIIILYTRCLCVCVCEGVCVLYFGFLCSSPVCILF